MNKSTKISELHGNGDLDDVSGCLSHEETKRFYQLMLKWEGNDLIDYSLMEGADYMQRTLAKRLGVDYIPK